MSDTIWKWAERTVDELTFGGKPLDLEHLAAISEVAARRVHERLPGNVHSEVAGSDGDKFLSAVMTAIRDAARGRDPAEFWSQFT